MLWVAHSKTVQNTGFAIRLIKTTEFVEYLEFGD